MTATKQRKLGHFTVSAIGLGAMPFSMGGNVKPSHDQAVETVHAALDAGVTLIDTADIYAPSWDTMGHNERIVADALASWGGDRSRVVVATKGGITRRSAETDFRRDGSLEYLREAALASRERLGVESIDLYYWHRPDRHRRYGESIEALATLRDEGIISEIGISNANVEEIRVAVEILGEGGLAAVQNEFSPKFHHTSYAELQYCHKHGIAFLPWSPLGGTSGGASAVGDRFPVIGEVAAARGVSPQQVTLAWELSLADNVIPIPGASKPASIINSAAAIDLELTGEELVALNAAILHV